MVHLPNATAEHNWLDPLEAILCISCSLTKAPGKSADQRLPKLVTIVAGTIRAIGENLKGRGHGRRIRLLCFPRQFVARNIQVADRVARNPCDDKGALTCALAITN